MCRTEREGEHSKVSHSVKERYAVGFSSYGEFLNLERGISEHNSLFTAR